MCFLLLFTGCSKKTARIESEGFSCNAVAKYDANTYHLFLEVMGGGILKAAVTKGDMKGMVLTLDGDDVSVQYLGMTYTLPDGFFGSNCILAVKEVLQALKRGGEEMDAGTENSVTLDTKLGRAKITLRPDGFPTKIVLPEQNAEITFSDFNYI